MANPAQTKGVLATFTHLHLLHPFFSCRAYLPITMLEMTSQSWNSWDSHWWLKG